MEVRFARVFTNQVLLASEVGFGRFPVTARFALTEQLPDQDKQTTPARTLRFGSVCAGRCSWVTHGKALGYNSK